MFRNESWTLDTYTLVNTQIAKQVTVKASWNVEVATVTMY